MRQRGASGRLRWLAIVVVAVAVATGLGLWVQQLNTPVTVAGQPTATVQPLPQATSATPTPTPTPTPSSPTPSAPASASATPEPMKASGKFDAAGVAIGAVSSAGKLRNYALRVETTAGLKADAAGTQVAGVLNDPRSWAGDGSVRFGLVADPAKATFRITLAAPATAAKLCVVAAGSCVSGTEVVIDAQAWRTLPATYGSLADWQAYLVNHAVGTLLGEKPATCLKAAKPAPVMMPQQSELHGCTANPWPNP